MANIEFGLMLQPRPNGLPVKDLFTYNVRLIKMLAGFSSIWIEDHLQWGDDPSLECLTTLSFLAGAFPQYKLGTMVLGQAYRNPALLAKMAATLQFISGGRLIVGIGAGWKEDEYQSYGYGEQLPPAGTRMKELEETLQILKALWNKPPATFEGRYYSVHGAYATPQPDPAIPLLIGGGGERRTLEIVARYADAWNFNSCTLEEYTRKLEILKGHCQRINRDPSEIALTYLSTISVSDDPSKVKRSPEKHFIAGSPAEVRAELERFAEIGVSHFIFRVPDTGSLQTFVDEVVPHFAT